MNKTNTNKQKIKNELVRMIIRDYKADTTNATSIIQSTKFIAIA